MHNETPRPSSPALHGFSSTHHRVPSRFPTLQFAPLYGIQEVFYPFRSRRSCAHHDHENSYWNYLDTTVLNTTYSPALRCERVQMKRRPPFKLLLFFSSFDEMKTQSVFDAFRGLHKKKTKAQSPSCPRYDYIINVNILRKSVKIVRAQIGSRRTLNIETLLAARNSPGRRCLKLFVKSFENKSFNPRFSSYTLPLYVLCAFRI